jgi:hypothetical protein
VFEPHPHELERTSELRALVISFAGGHHSRSVFDEREMSHLDFREFLPVAGPRPVRVDDLGLELLPIQYGIIGQVFFEEARIGAKLRLA